jgi:ABC-type glycerol-3-phosphate transport system substrate-binding protein
MERSRERFALATGNPFGTTNDQSIQMFASEQAAMLSNGTWTIAPIRELNPDGNFGIFALPADNANDTAARLFVDDALMISSRTKNMDAITALFNFATSAEGANIWAEKTCLIPAVKGVTLKNPNSMVADAEAQVKSGKTIFADTTFSPSGQLWNILVERFSADFLADQSKSIDRWIADLDTEYSAAAAAK